MVRKNKRVSETEHIHVSYPCKASTVLQLRLDNGQFIDFYPLNANIFILTRIIARVCYHTKQECQINKTIMDIFLSHVFKHRIIS